MSDHAKDVERVSAERDAALAQVAALREALESVGANERCTCSEGTDGHYNCPVRIATEVLENTSAAAQAYSDRVRAEAFGDAEDAAHDAIHDAIEEMGQCARVTEAVAAAIRSAAART